MYGIVAMLIGFFIKSIIIFAFGCGLFIDEVTYILIQGETHADNYSFKSILGTIILIIIVFIFRNLIVREFYFAAS